MSLDKLISLRLSNAVRNLANQSIIAYAIKKNIKPENFSEYIRRLIEEDHDKYVKTLNKSINLQKIEKVQE